MSWLAGSAMVKVLPSPSTLSIVTVPRCASTMCRTMASPSPVPRIPPEVDAAPRTNFWNTASCSDAGMPIPRSRTPIAHQAVCPAHRHLDDRGCPRRVLDGVVEQVPNPARDNASASRRSDGGPESALHSKAKPIPVASRRNSSVTSWANIAASIGS